MSEYNISQTKIIDEISDNEFYIGLSNNGSNIFAANWRINKIIKIGSVWNFIYPNGDQSYDFIWNDRGSYTYA